MLMVPLWGRSRGHYRVMIRCSVKCTVRIVFCLELGYGSDVQGST